MSADSSKVSKFKQHCDQIFQEDAGGKSSLVALERLVEQDMANTYRIPVSPILSGNSSASKDKQTQLRGLWHQLTQHLVDLRYISEQEFLEYQGRKKRILEQRQFLLPIISGVEKYLRQETAADIRELLNSYDPGSHLTEFWVEQHLATIAEAIAKYTSFDGSLVPPENYEIGEDSCYGRSLAFRMRVIFAMDEALDEADIFDRSMIKYTISLDNILKLGSQPSPNIGERDLKDSTISAEFWAQVCDLDHLFEAFFAAVPEKIQDKAYAITYKYQREGDQFKASDYELIYLDRPAVNNSGNSPKWTVGRINRADRLKAGIYANIACRLLQLKLWQTSFYLGAIDGDWGEMSHEAVLDAYKLELSLWEGKENKAHVRKKKFQKYSKRTVKRSVFHKSKKGIIAIDLEDMHQILQNYVSTLEESSAAGENELAIINQLRSKAQISDERLDKAILTEKSLNKCYDAASGSPKRRVSYVSMKNKSFFKGLIRGIGKIVSWIVGAFKKVLGLIFSFAKAIIDRIRKGFQLFAKGFRYISHLLLGRPIVAPRENPKGNTIPIFTRFQLDFDAINFIPKNTSTAELKAHMATLDMMRKSMIFFIDVVLFVIKAISKLTQPGGWVSLGIMIFRWLFRRMAELFQEEPQHEWSNEIA